MSRKWRRLLWALPALAVVLLVLWLLAARMTQPVTENVAKGGEFTLQSAQGPVALSDFRGKLVLLYFGYTYCPDICPTSLAATVAGLKALKPDELNKVKLIFVSLDPERDTPARLKEYAEFFHPDVLGLTGSNETLADLARRYGVFYARQKVDTAGGGYVIDHTSETYVIDPAGALKGKIRHAAPVDEVVKTIRSYLSQY